MLLEPTVDTTPSITARLTSSAEAAPVAAAAPAANPLSFADGRVVFGIEDQLRYECRDNNYDFNSAATHINDDAWFLQRARISMQVKPADWLTFYIQGQDSREIGSRRSDVPGVLGAEGDNPFDLRQLYVEIGDEKRSPFSAKIGRQVLLYGDQRLIGPLEWNNITRTFDAVKLRYAGKDGLWVDLFTSSLVVVDGKGMDASDWDSTLSGIYANIPTLGIQNTELYALYSDDSNRNDHFITIGTHIKSLPGKFGPWDYEAEFAVQSGKAGGRDLSTFASYVELKAKELIMKKDDISQHVYIILSGQVAVLACEAHIPSPASSDVLAVLSKGAALGDLDVVYQSRR